jgi:hypothetical protein
LPRRRRSRDPLCSDLIFSIDLLLDFKSLRLCPTFCSECPLVNRPHTFFYSRVEGFKAIFCNCNMTSLAFTCRLKGVDRFAVVTPLEALATKHFCNEKFAPCKFCCCLSQHILNGRLHFLRGSCVPFTFATHKSCDVLLSVL